MMNDLFYPAEVEPQLRAIRPLFNYGFGIRPDLYRLRSHSLPLALLALMNRGYRSAEALSAYFLDHRGRFDASDVERVLRQHSATMGFDNGEADGLWRVFPDGSYEPLFKDGEVSIDA